MLIMIALMSLSIWVLWRLAPAVMLVPVPANDPVRAHLVRRRRHNGARHLAAVQAPRTIDEIERFLADQ